MAPEQAVASFDSASAFLMALARALNGQDFRYLGQARWKALPVRASVLLPRSLRDPGGAGTADAPAAAPKTDGVRRGHVLLVEDDRDVSALTREMLSSLGFSVTHASSALAALGALANSRAIDVVLSDIMMPGGVSGVQLAREIRRRQPHLPILLMTGYLEAASDLENGEFELLLKPFSLEALAAVLSVPATTDADVT